MAWCWGLSHVAIILTEALPYSYIIFFVNFLLTLIPQTFLSILLGKHVVLT